MDFDAAWCPVCDRQIQPKRIQVPVPPPPPPTLPLPSGSNTSPTKQQQSTIRRTKGGTIKRGAHTQGTGLVRPTGTIKRTDSAQKSQQTDTPKPTQPIKHRTIIDQSPIPLYCSDECQLADLHNQNRGLPLNPGRATSPVPSQTFTLTASETESDATGSSFDSVSSVSSSTSNPTHISPSLATLAAIYKFPPPPPPAPVYSEELVSSDSDYPHDYNSGIMMAGRFLNSVCPKPTKRTTYGVYPQPPEPRKPIPGWSDGSNAWRSCVYSFSPPKKVEDSPNSDSVSKAYKSFTATSHRSHSIYSTLGESSSSTPRNAYSTTSLPAANNELIQKYSQSFSRRCESRSSGSMSTSPSSTHSFPTTLPSSQRRERSLVQRGAEGKLLVPNVKLKVNNGSSTSLSSAWSGPRSVRSPLSVTSSDSSDEETTVNTKCGDSPAMPFKRPAAETRSWSYDNFKTYPIMQLPPKKETRKEKQLVDGVEVEVEVDVIVEQPLKRLFLFAPSTRRA
ncbi:hypothetical protein AMATHDRAFT_45019 [Amanita thiersii Skay4041]|uniref:Uncharacterized protein n=1 Tax=Amanita thiersii Skay4041 TaxID=703135 RepID=A0A2A9NSL2_9AGAR|nr:hypothetical protein AMATHDRAFT_45019 [Amanita thiersii Skay4041]